MNPTVDPIQAARDAAFDMDLIDSNLALTPEERLRQHVEALAIMLALEEGRRAIEAKPYPTPGTAR